MVIPPSFISVFHGYITALYKMSTVPSLCLLTVSAHAQRQALLQAAVLATVTVSPVDQTVPLAGTRIHGIVLLAAAEEALNKQKHSQLLEHRWMKKNKKRCLG